MKSLKCFGCGCLPILLTADMGSAVDKLVLSIGRCLLLLRLAEDYPSAHLSISVAKDEVVE